MTAHVISPAVALVLLAAMLLAWMLLERKLGAFLAARVKVVVIPTGGGDGVEVRGRIKGAMLHYRWAGTDRATAAAPEAVVGMRRKWRRLQVIHVDARSGTPIVFPADGTTPRHLWSDKIDAASKHLLKASFKAPRGGPFAELAPFVPLMMLVLLAMVAAILYATGRAQGWF